MKTHLRMMLAATQSLAIVLNRHIAKAPHPSLRAEFEEARRDLSLDARAANIALGFLKGRQLFQVEQPYRAHNQGHVTSRGKTKTHPKWDRVEALVMEYGLPYFDSQQEMMQRWAEFRGQADLEAEPITNV